MMLIKLVGRFCCLWGAMRVSGSSPIWDFFAIGDVCLAGAGVVICHSGVDLSFIRVDGCPKDGVEVCH